MMLRIWGRVSSVNVQKVVWCADEIGLAYERIDVGGRFGGNDTPEYLVMNPNGLVPVIDDEGFVLSESNAIVRYLAAKHSPDGLWPDDLRRRADVDRWMEWQSTAYTPAMWAAFWQLVRTPEDRRDTKAIESSIAKTDKLSAVLDAQLASRRFLCGEAFTAADIVVGCAAHRWLSLPVERSPRPHLERWYADLKSRPGSREVTSQALS
ncbi:MAG: glutathione S-transferase family protein [Usitatibacter sp.]